MGGGMGGGMGGMGGDGGFGGIDFSKLGGMGGEGMGGDESEEDDLPDEEMELEAEGPGGKDGLAEGIARDDSLPAGSAKIEEVE